MKNKIYIIIINLFIFCSCKKDNNNPLPEPALKKAFLGNWNLVSTKIVYKSGLRPSNLACVKNTYIFSANDTCIFDVSEKIPFKISSNTQLIFDGGGCVDGHIYNVEIRNDTMQWDQVPPFQNYDIAQWSYYFKRQP